MPGHFPCRQLPRPGSGAGLVDIDVNRDTGLREIRSGAVDGCVIGRVASQPALQCVGCFTGSPGFLRAAISRMMASPFRPMARLISMSSGRHLRCLAVGRLRALASGSRDSRARI